MSPPVDPVASDPALPARTDVVIIGGGIIGVSTALFLAEKGIAVALCEKGRIGGEQSSRNWGWCRTMGRDPSEIPLAMESLRLWRDMNRRTNRETGFRQAGIMYLCQTETEIAAQESWFGQAGPFQVDARLLRDPALDKVMPGATHCFIAGMHTPTDGKAEPALAAPAIAEAARDQGAQIFTNMAVRGIEQTAGRLTGVVTERGRIACQSVILAGGVWSRLFAGNAGLDLPQLKVLGSVFRTKKLNGPDITAAGMVFAFRKRMDGGYSIARRNANTAEITPDHFRLLHDFLPRLINSRNEIRLRVGIRSWEELRTARHWSLDQPTPFEAIRVLDPKPKQGILAEACSVLPKAFPPFARMELVESWAGLMDVTPDAVPVIDRVIDVSPQRSDDPAYRAACAAVLGRACRDIFFSTPPATASRPSPPASSTPRALSSQCQPSRRIGCRTPDPPTTEAGAARRGDAARPEGGFQYRPGTGPGRSRTAGRQAVPWHQPLAGPTGLARSGACLLRGLHATHRRDPPWFRPGPRAGRGLLHPAP